MVDNDRSIKMDNSVHSIEEYIKKIQQYYNDTCFLEKEKIGREFKCSLWFRGVKRDDYDLLPSICRGELTTDYETYFMSRFKSKAISYVENMPSYWGWLFLMQHYGVKTRLMDWTRDAMTALLFAVIDAREDEREQNAAVWCLDPIKLNEGFKFYDYYEKGYIPNVEEDIVTTTFGPGTNKVISINKPCAVIGPMNNPRIIAQKGVFTVFPNNEEVTPLNKLRDSSEYLRQIVICANSRDYILDQLQMIGIKKSSLFPELSTIAEEIESEGY